MKTAYESVWKAIIRPSRDTYNISNLGPSEFTYQGTTYSRIDLQLKNPRNYTLQCSHFYEKNKDVSAQPCVVYLHTNLGSRVEALGVLHVLLPLGVTVFCFDCAGSGLSEGEYVSLGYWEKEDLACVLTYLRCLNPSRQIALWGRGMGAVAALLQLKDDLQIAGAVLDSAYESLPRLAKELAHRVANAPDFLLSQVIKIIRKTILKRAQFDMNALSPIDNLSSVHTPALFATALQDSFINSVHSETLFNAYGEQVKRIIKFEGDHNSPRPLYFLQEASRFLVEAFRPAA